MKGIVIFDFSDNVENWAIRYLIDDIDYFKRNYGGKQVNDRITLAVYNGVLSAIEYNDRSIFCEAMDVARSAHLPNESDLLYHLEAAFFEGVDEWNCFALVTDRYFDQYDVSDPRLLEDAARKYANSSDQLKKEHLKKATEWIEKAIQIDNSFDNHFTYARLLERQGKRKQALAACEEAIRVGSIQERDLSDVRRLRERLLPPIKINTSGKSNGRRRG